MTTTNLTIDCCSGVNLQQQNLHKPAKKLGSAQIPTKSLYFELWSSGLRAKFSSSVIGYSIDSITISFLEMQNPRDPLLLAPAECLDLYI